MLYSYAAHADNVTGRCYTAMRTMSRESGVGMKKLRRVIALLDAGGVTDRRRRTTVERKLMPGGAFESTIISTDGPRGFLPVSQDWMNKHARLNPACRCISGNMERLRRAENHLVKKLTKCPAERTRTGPPTARPRRRRRVALKAVTTLQNEEMTVWF